MLAAHGVEVFVGAAEALTPTTGNLVCDPRPQPGPDERLGGTGIVVTPSHNPPDDGGFKYTPPHGGPADTNATQWIERRANELLGAGGLCCPRQPDAV